ncbi:MAG: radical SAM family heme chaperone HemW [Paludibacteraceae bacterium]|nr:radical SAM family heme chaperone HemW [Paludibacteraceae bacterium]
MKASSLLSSIYIHIPFCKKRCSYCNFYSTVKFEHLNNYVETLCGEIIERQNFLSNKNIRTLYFGGGTPSQLSALQINIIYDTVSSVYNMENLEEFTIECNPDDISPEYIESLHTTNVNRISIGVQSLDDNILQFINRRHNADAARTGVRNLLTSGYENISIDLIYGIPGQSFESWKQTVDEAVTLGVKHISAYNLSFEEGTEMYKYIDKAPDEEICISMYNYLCKTLKDYGFEHYEISNFAKEGYRSKHNSVYWQGGEYLGIGAGAHSYNGKQRFENGGYKVQGDGNLHWDVKIETLTEQDKYNELIITALRTKEGVNSNKIPNKYLKHFIEQSEPYLEKGELVKNGNFTAISEKGVLISDYIMRNLIL